MWLLAFMILSDSIGTVGVPAEALRVTEIGAGDPVVLIPGRAAEIAVLAQRLGTFAMDTVPGAGHFLYEERPDVVVSAVDRVSGRAGPRWNSPRPHS